MTLKEQLAEKKAALETTTKAAEEGGEDVSDQLAELIEDVEKLQEAIDEADKAKTVLANIGTAADEEEEIEEEEEEVTEEEKARTTGAKAALAVKKSGATRGNRFHVSVKAGENLRPTGDYFGDVLTEVHEDILEGPRRPMTVADLFAASPTNSSAVTYYVEGTVDGTPETIAEAGQYPTLTFGEPQSQTDPVQKIGCIYKDSDEILADAERLAASYDQRADYLMDVVEEDQLLAGDGNGSNIVGLLNRSGLQTATASSYAELVDIIKTCKVSIKKNTPNFYPDAVLINDEDWDKLTSIKDENGQYLVGGPYIGQYGNASANGDEPPIWGLKVVPTQALEPGTLIVGAFKLGGTVYRNGGRDVEITNSDEDDFSHGLVSFRPSERIALAVQYPAAFVKVTFTASDQG